MGLSLLTGFCLAKSVDSCLKLSLVYSGTKKKGPFTSPSPINVCMHACMYVCMHVCMYASVYMHTCIHTYMHTYIHTSMHACMHTCMHTYIHTYIHTTCGCMSVCVCVCVCVCVRACVYYGQRDLLTMVYLSIGPISEGQFFDRSRLRQTLTSSDFRKR